MAKRIIPTLTCLFFAHLSWACSCGILLIDLPLQEMGWAQTKTAGTGTLSDLIFTGILIEAKKVEEVWQSDFSEVYQETRYELTFQLIKSYKGDYRDTMKIRTNYGTDACGFGAKLNTECLIFAVRAGNGYYYTYRSDCCKSISKEQEEKRFNQYILFLESIINMVDGEYIFYQSNPYWRQGYKNVRETIEAMRYNIKNGKFEGSWQVQDRRGRILEKGEYQNGEKVGTWVIASFVESDLEEADEQIMTEKIRYRKGLPVKSRVLVEDKMFVWEEDADEFYQTIRVQRWKKKFKTYAIKK